ncbi:MAG: hypothetical protein WDA14_12345 [Sphaerochaetaceae bacterium]|jgi:hypothetical protein
MDGDYKVVSIDQSDLDELKNEIRKSKANFGGVIILLILILIGLTYLSINVYRETNSSEVIDSSGRVLLVGIGSDDSDLSDETQVKNALSNGGMVQLSMSKDTLKDVLSSDVYGYYGASDSEGYYYTLGALLNYIASRGWTLIQAPSTGLSDEYYFIK